jgi:hypothetical protein
LRHRDRADTDCDDHANVHRYGDTNGDTYSWCDIDIYTQSNQRAKLYSYEHPNTRPDCDFHSHAYCGTHGYTHYYTDGNRNT